MVLRLVEDGGGSCYNTGVYYGVSGCSGAGTVEQRDSDGEYVSVNSHQPY